MQELKGNFSELFTSGDEQSRWEALKSIDLYLNTKILRLSNASVDVGKNKLEDVTPLSEVNLKNLKYLHLSTCKDNWDDNLISSLGQLENVDFKNLQVLSLDNNQIRDLAPLERVNLRCLQVLSLNSNLIDSFEGLDKVNFRVLQGLALSSNQLEDAKLLKSLDYKGLFWMELSKKRLISENNQFSKETIEWIKKLTVKNKGGSKICIYVWYSSYKKSLLLTVFDWPLGFTHRLGELAFYSLHTLTGEWTWITIEQTIRQLGQVLQSQQIVHEAQQCGFGVSVVSHAQPNRLASEGALLFSAEMFDGGLFHCYISEFEVELVQPKRHQ